MKTKTKKLASLVTASILAFSAICGGSVLTASAEVDKVTDLTLVSSDGLWAGNGSNSSVYTNGLYGYSIFTQTSSAVGDISRGSKDSTTGLYPGLYKDKVAVGSISLADKGTPLYLATTSGNLGDGVTAAGKERYMIIPIIRTNTGTPNTTNSRTLNDYVVDFSNATIKIDLAKGSGYGNYVKSTQDKIVGYKIGLAYVDYSISHKYSYSNKTDNGTAYGTDIAWIDICPDSKNVIHGLNSYTSQKTFDEVKHTVSASVSDIIAGAHTKLHSATEAVTAENANAVVIGIILNDRDITGSGSLLHYNNLEVISPPVSATAVVESIGEGRYKAGAVFESINPSKYENVVFKVGNDYYGNTVTEAFGGSVINGDAKIGVILSDATDPDVSVLFTNQTITFK